MYDYQKNIKLRHLMNWLFIISFILNNVVGKYKSIHICIYEEYSKILLGIVSHFVEIHFTSEVDFIESFFNGFI